MSEVGPSQRGPLTQSLASPRSKARGVKGAIRILRRRARRGNIAVSGRAPGLPALPSAGQPRNGRHPCQRSAQAKETLNAKPRTAVQQSQGESVEVRILRRRTAAGTSPQAGRARATALLSAGQPRNGRHPCQRLAQCQRGSLTQSPASPRSKASGKASRSASSGAGQEAGTSLSVQALRRGTANENIAASDASPRPTAPNGN